jgi:excisionase family DNA binding protein
MTGRLAYSDKEAAGVLGLSVRSIVYLRRTGKLGFSKIGRRVLIPAAEPERLLRRTSVKPAQAIDADEPIRPRGTNTKASTGEVEAFKTTTGDSAKSPVIKV